ncbi:hypothetical protein [Pseudomonas sp. PSE14]|uniref:hypothetical protein n=1 Tax=Pseudomonas sp. PSE14 TaxID=3016341 RepID=UPI0023D81AEB|nr:hypothetical protein [Pseudomonas sp. PSE14]WEJ74465.1 hypothetical protein O6P39_11515 [Pseudomonas sp. PSE14]
MSYDPITPKLRASLNKGPQGRAAASSLVERIEEKVYRAILEPQNASQWETTISKSSDGVTTLKGPFGMAVVSKGFVLTETDVVARITYSKRLKDQKGSTYWKSVWELEAGTDGFVRSGGANTPNLDIHEGNEAEQVMDIAASILIALGRCTT